MSILKKKRKSKKEEITEEVKVEEVTTEEVTDEDIQTTFNEDLDGVFEDVVFIDEETALAAEEIEREDN